MNIAKLFPLAFLASFGPACVVQPTDAPPTHEDVGAAVEADTETAFNDMTLDAGTTVYSYDKRTFLVMQGDGNLVLYFAPFGQSVWAHPLWASNTAGNSGAFAVMQGDGNLVVYGSKVCFPAPPPLPPQCFNSVLWQSKTSNAGGASMNYASVQNDGNFVVADLRGTLLQPHRCPVRRRPQHPGELHSGVPRHLRRDGPERPLPERVPDGAVLLEQQRHVGLHPFGHLYVDRQLSQPRVARSPSRRLRAPALQDARPPRAERQPRCRRAWPTPSPPTRTPAPASYGR
jgi:hypothetical protein